MHICNYTPDYFFFLEKELAFVINKSVFCETVLKLCIQRYSFHKITWKVEDSAN